MFDPGIIANPSADQQRQAVAAVVRTALDDGTFTYTELLSSKEPMRSFGLEYLDGIKVQGTIPIYGTETVEHWNDQGGRHLLAHIEASGSIKHPVRKDVRVPGANLIRREEVTENFGNVALVTDAFGERFARNILYQQGWPVRQNSSGGSHAGDVVEVKWLKKEAALGEKAAHGVLELWAQIAPRVEAWEAAQAKKASDARKKINDSKSAGATP